MVWDPDGIEFIGDHKVGRSLYAKNIHLELVNLLNVNSQITGKEHDYHWTKITLAEGSGDIDFVLPNAQQLENGYSKVIHNLSNSASDSVLIKDNGGTLLKEVPVDYAYKVTLVDNSTTNGVWFFNLLEDHTTLAASRYVYLFNDTTDWSVSGDDYLMVVNLEDHVRGVDPQVQIFRDTGSGYELVDIDSLTVLPSGDVNFKIPSFLSKFSGKVVFL